MAKRLHKGKKTSEKIVEDVVIEKPEEIVEAVKALEADAAEIVPDAKPVVEHTASTETKTIEETRKFVETSVAKRVKNAEEHATMLRLRRRGRR